MSKQKIVITGGAGFIGSHLCTRLVEAGYRVTCLDNLSSGSIENISQLTDEPGFSFFKHDICMPFSHEADIIINLASPASPIDYIADPLATLRQYLQGSFETRLVSPHRIGTWPFPNR